MSTFPEKSANEPRKPVAAAAASSIWPVSISIVPPAPAMADETSLIDPVSLERPPSALDVSIETEDPESLLRSAPIPLTSALVCLAPVAEKATLSWAAVMAMTKPLVAETF